MTTDKPWQLDDGLTQIREAFEMIDLLIENHPELQRSAVRHSLVAATGLGQQGLRALHQAQRS